MQTDDSNETGPPHDGPVTRGSRLVVPIVVALALALFGVALWRAVPPDAPEFKEDVHVLAVPLDIADFELVDHLGDPFTRASLSGRWSLLFFGYTYCPDVCPVTLQSLVPVQSQLGAPGDPRVVFVSVDPARDDVARMAEYVGFFHPRYLGVTGEPEQIESLTRAVGAYNAAREPEPGADGYLVDHASSLFFIGPDARLRAVLHEPAEPAPFVDLLRRIQALEPAS